MFILLSAFATSIAAATQPLVLVLAGGHTSELKYEGSSGSTKLEITGLKSMACTKAKFSGTYNASEAKPEDAETGAATVDFEGCKQK